MQECFIRTSLSREALILLVSIPDGIKEVNSRASQHSIPPTGPGWVTPRFQAQWCEQTSVASHQCFLSSFVHYITQSNKACCSKLPFDCCHTQPCSTALCVNLAAAAAAVAAAAPVLPGHVAAWYAAPGPYQQCAAPLCIACCTCSRGWDTGGE